MAKILKGFNIVQQMITPRGNISEFTVKFNCRTKYSRIPYTTPNPSTTAFDDDAISF